MIFTVTANSSYSMILICYLYSVLCIRLLMAAQSLLFTHCLSFPELWHFGSSSAPQLYSEER